MTMSTPSQVIESHAAPKPGPELMPQQRMVRRHTLAEQVVEYVRDRISQNVLKPGQKLTIQGLAGELNISMTPVREAIKTLAAMRLVVVEVNKSLVIAQPDAEDVRQLMVVYNNLESLAVDLVVKHASDAQIALVVRTPDRSVAIAHAPLSRSVKPAMGFACCSAVRPFIVVTGTDWMGEEERRPALARRPVLYRQKGIASPAKPAD